MKYSTLICVLALVAFNTACDDNKPGSNEVASPEPKVETVESFKSDLEDINKRIGLFQKHIPEHENEVEAYQSEIDFKARNMITSIESAVGDDKKTAEMKEQFESEIDSLRSQKEISAEKVITKNKVLNELLSEKRELFKSVKSKDLYGDFLKEQVNDAKANVESAKLEVSQSKSQIADVEEQLRLEEEVLKIVTRSPESDKRILGLSTEKEKLEELLAAKQVLVEIRSKKLNRLIREAVSI